MQDNRDGAVRGLDHAFLEQQKKMLANITGKTYAQAQREAFVKTGEKAGIPEQYQGPVFTLGEELVIKGGRFKVARFRHGKMLLQGLPLAKT